MEETAPTVGVFHHPREADPVTIGRSVVVDDLARALANHGRRFRYRLYCDVRAVKQVAQSLHSSRVEVRDRRALRGVDALAPIAWHDPQFEINRPVALRARARRPFPITILHHTLSYRDLLHDAVLRLLLGRLRPYDSVICSTPAARTVVQLLVEHVASRFQAEHGLRLPADFRYDVVPLGVDTDRYAPASDRAAARAELQIHDDAFVLLWVGRLSIVDKADLLPLVRAFAELRRRNGTRRVMLVCAGSERPGERFGAMLRSYAARLGTGEDVRVMADGTSFSTPRLYAAADVFVSPVDNVQESFGLAPIEAMASGLPQIVSDWDGYRDNVVEGETGFLIPTSWARCQDELSEDAMLSDSPSDHLALAQSVAVDMDAMMARVQELIDNPDLRARMGEASRHRALAQYAWPVVIARHEELWTELAERARGDADGPRPALSHECPDYARFFAHYPTRMLDEQSRLRLTPFGRSLIQGQGELPTQYVEQWRYLDAGTAQRILVGCEHADRANQSIALGSIVSTLGRHPKAPVSRDTTLRHVLFLVKYGVLAEERSAQT